MRKEIEVKARVGNLQTLQEKFLQLGCQFSAPLTQEDRILIDFTGSYTDFRQGVNFLRIRYSNDKYLFTIKQPQENELDCIEHETEISDPDEFAKALILMGYREVIQVKKVRQKAKYKDYEICLDQVDGLGSFVEVEKITDAENSEVVQEELFSFLETLGIKREDRVVNGYDTLLYLKNTKNNI